MRRAGDDKDGGFMMVDALVGTVIIALMITVCLATLKISRTLSQTAADAKGAQAVLTAVMETTPRVTGDYSGRSGEFSYRVQVKKQTFNTITFCQLNASAVRGDGHHTYRLTGTRWCAATV